MLDKTPLVIGVRLPERSVFDASTRAHAVPGLFTLTWPTLSASSSHLDQEPLGLPEFLNVSLYLHATA
jgi:hypothetical protein